MNRRDSISVIQENLKYLWENDSKYKKSKENEYFGIVWRITNFTMCKLQKGEYFESPIFVAESLQNTNWYLRLYPRGDTNCDHIVCYLLRGNSPPDSIIVRYNLSIGISNECIDQVQTFEKYSLSLVPAYARREQVLNEVRKYPLVDILLVDCRIWNCQRKEPIPEVKSMVSYLHNHEYSADYLPQEMIHSSMDGIENLKRKLRPYPGSCSAYTRIPVERWYFHWCIKNFCKRQKNEKETITVVSVSENAPKILMTFFVNEKSNLEMNIRELTGKYGSPFTVHCKIQLVGIHERNVEVLQEMHLFVSDEIWKLPLCVSQIEIVQQEDRFLLNDKMTFRCELAISYESEVSNIDSCSYISDDSSTNQERHISHGHSRTISKYLTPAWTHLKLFSFTCVISILLSFIYNIIAHTNW